MRFLRTVKLPAGAAPAVVRDAFASRRYSAAAPRAAGRIRSPRGPMALWASPAYGGGWCEGLQQPRLRFDRLSVSCIWPRRLRRHGIAVYGYVPRLFFGRVPQRSAVVLRLRLSNGRSLRVPTRSGFFLFRVPDRVLAQAGPRALVARDREGKLVAREQVFSFVPSLMTARGISRPPGGAKLAEKRELVARETPLGRASIWAAPSSAGRVRCTWLQVRKAVYGGTCRRIARLPQGLEAVVPLRLRIEGRDSSLLWGQVGRDVVSLQVEFQDGSRAALRIAEGVYLYPVPREHWKQGSRPAFVIARDAGGRLLGKRLLWEYTAAA